MRFSWSTRAPRARALLALALVAASGSRPARAQEIPTPDGMSTAVMHDPSLDMDAFAVFVPNGWHYQGTLMQGTTCKPVPFPVFRSTSPDGLAMQEVLPRLDWTWGYAARFAHTASDCLPVDGPMRAEDVARYIAATMHVEYVAADEVPPALLDKGQRATDTWNTTWVPRFRASGMLPPTYTVSLARAIVRFRNGSFAMEGQLTVRVDCWLANAYANPRFTSSNCAAGVVYITAPAERYQATAALFGPDAFTTLPAWQQAWDDRNARQSEAVRAQIRADADANIAAMQAQGAADRAATVANGQAFRAQQAARQQIHEEFLGTMQRGTDMSMNRAAEIANSNHAIAQDWVDYSLNQQTVRDPSTGQISKVSSAGTYTWIDQSGTTSYQTRDPNADPNGSLPGTWTRQQVVHGDGSSNP